ncbi:Hpt domain-containing protein [Variovorax sp. YR216]|uniref:hybrid sensor histidine kinase/response regulator n=1 Tax=Variovorax sp. YR216 TaxID=1882828 RepID=UPI00089A2E5D|nr:Hpt domain-containing protein [Variovorax sp. YR216]SEA75827.1 chemosensory pili system protein ChpA (sensor histidine kinase/response regulator) [Variovorax sp. YR216]
MSIQSPAAHTAGNAPATEDLGPLAWVLGEIQKSLDAVGKTLRRFSRDAASALPGSEIDSMPVRQARQQLHQAVGALQMVGHTAPALVLGAMEFAVQSFVTEPLRCNDAAVQKIERAGFAVADFLNAVVAGKTVSSVALFPQYREVLELVGNERVHPADLWNMTWRWVEIKPAPTQTALVYDPAVRSKLDREVLQVVKSGDDHAARRLQALCLGLGRGASVPRVASFWTLAAGFFEALALALIPADSHVKRAASRVLLQYATLARGDNTVSDRLGQDLLFFCAQAVPGTGDEAATLRAVRAAWGISNEQKVDYTIEQFGRFDPLVLAQARKRIETSKEMWSALSGGDVGRTRQVVETFAQLGESLQKLHPPSLPMVQALNNAVDASVRSGQPPATELAMEVATSVLYLEAAFEDLDPQDRQLTARTIQLAGRIERARDGGRSEPLEPWMEELYRRVSDRQTMGTVVGELRSHLAELEKSLDQFFRRPTEKGLLRNVPSQLLQMRGVFSVLGLDQAAQTVQRMRENVDQLLAEESPTDEIRAFDSLGNNLGALGFLIDMLSYQPALAKRLFVFDADIGELKPLMGRQASDASSDAAAPAAFASASGPVAVTEAVMSVEQVDAQIAAKLAALATTPGARKSPPPSPIEEFSQAATSWTSKITGPAPLEALPDTEVTELEEDDLQNIFLDEAREVLHNGLAAVSALGARPDDEGELTVLRRAFHTLKGSSRMVGLMDFGEAAWSLEQVLNTWLADQRPATPELLTGTRNTLQDFAQWVEAIAAGGSHGWKSAPFLAIAESLRTGEPLETPARVADAEALVAAARHIAAEAAAEVPPAPMEPVPLPELPDLPDLRDLELELDLDLKGAEAQPADVPAQAPSMDSAVAHAEEPTVWSGLDGTPDESLQTAPEQLPSDAPRSDEGFASTDFLDFDAKPEPPPEEAASLGEYDDGDFLETVHTALEPSLVSAASRTKPEPEELPPLELEREVAAVLQPEAEPEPRVEEVAAEPALAPTPEPELAELAELAFALGLEPEVPAVPEPMVEVEASAPAETPVIDELPVAHDEVRAEMAAPEIPPVHVAEPPVEAVAAAPEEPQPERTPVLSAEEQVKVIGPLRIGIALYNVYLNEADEWSRQLATEVGEWALETHQRVPMSAIGLAHSLAGSSATVGFQSLSGMARLFEAALQHLHTQGRGTPEQGAVLVAAAEEVRRLLHQFAAGFLREPAEDTVEALRNVEASQLPVETVEPAAAPLHLVRNVGSDVSLDDSDDASDVVDAVDMDLFPIFEEEANELLPQLGAALRDWVQNPESSASRASSLRTLHTLKGSARLAGAMRLGERAHRMESDIEAIGAEGADRQAIEQVLTRFDALQANFDALRAADDATQAELVQRAATPPAPVALAVAPEAKAPATPPVVEAATPEHEAEAEAAPAAAEPAGEPLAGRATIAAPSPSVLTPLRAVSSQAVRIRTHLLDRLVAQAGEVIITRSRLEAELGQLRSSLTDLTGNLDRLRQQLRDIEVQAESQMQSRLAQAKDSQQGFDPLEFDRFTRVQELTRMMAESVNDVATVQRTLQKTVQATEDDLSAQARQTRELQRGLLRTRMVEFEGISDRLYRVVRQASKDTGKQVRLDITGGSIEMDRGVLERMTPAFEHLLRNCVAHGIEDAAVREKAGKDPSGLIVIELHQEGNDVSVSFQDDGGGLKYERIVARARALGLVAEGQQLSDEEAAELIYQPGFSTAEQVSELAGRGIGMDVVRAQVAGLGGRIETRSKPGQGTTFKLVLPLTTAVTHVVMMRAGGVNIGVPSNLVELVLRAGASELEKAYLDQHYPFGGEDVPFYWAGALLQSSPGSERAPGKANTIVVVRSAAQRVALHVDEVLGNQEVVVKNLGPQLSRLPGMAAISVLASGAVALIYNPVALAAVHSDKARAFQASANRGRATPDVGGTAPQTPVVQVPAQVPLVLVVDDSITVRRVTQRLLQREGYRVALAADGLQALERLQQERPAVVLSDIEMPRMDGFDLARNIRADQSLADLPIIMITSRIAEKHHDHARALGVNHYLGKPYSEEELLRLVRSYTGVELPVALVA